MMFAVIAELRAAVEAPAGNEKNQD